MQYLIWCAGLFLEFLFLREVGKKILSGYEAAGPVSHWRNYDRELGPVSYWRNYDRGLKALRGANADDLC